MKTTNLNLVSWTAVVISALTIVACGKDGGGGGGSNNNQTVATVPAGQCVQGQVYTQNYGCLQAGTTNCGGNQNLGYHPGSNSCYPGTLNTWGNGNGNGWGGQWNTMCNPNYGCNNQPYYVPQHIYQPYYTRYGAEWFWVWKADARRNGTLKSYYVR